MELILGTAQLAGRYGVMAREGASEVRAVAVLEAASRLGVRIVDTAPVYEGAEATIGAAGAAFAVHTKIPSGEEPSAALASSLRRLRRDWVEVLYLHDPEVVLDAQDPRLASAAGLVGAGAGAIGASVYTREQFLAAVTDLRITVIQAPMNVLDRRIGDEDLRFAERSGTEVIARSALLQGLLGDPARALGRIPQLDEALIKFYKVCDRVGRAPVELAISWVRSRPGVTGVVVGAETAEQLDGIARAFQSDAFREEELNEVLCLPLPIEQDVDPRFWNESRA